MGASRYNTSMHALSINVISFPSTSHQHLTVAIDAQKMGEARLGLLFYCSLLFNVGIQQICYSCRAEGTKWAKIAALAGRAWLAQLVRSLPSEHKVPSSIPGTAKIGTNLCATFVPA